MVLIAVRQEVNYLESSVVVQEISTVELAINDCLWSVGNQYNGRTLTWISLALTPKFRVVWQPCPSTTTFSLKEAAVYRHSCQ